MAVDGWSGYYPIAHEGGGNLDKRIVLDWFQDILNTNANKIFHNAMYDVTWIKAMGLNINGRIIDTMIAGSLINENRFSYTLDSMGKEYVGFGKNETNLKDAARDWNIDPKKDMWRLPAMEVGTYAEKDAELTLKLWQRLQQELTSQDLWTIFTLETDLFPCLIDMKFKGVRVDMQRASDIKEELIKKEKLALQDIKKQVGFDVEIWAAASCAKAFDFCHILLTIFHCNLFKSCASSINKTLNGGVLLSSINSSIRSVKSFIPFSFLYFFNS